MTKPTVTRTMAKTALICAAVCFALQVVCVLCTKQLAVLFMGGTSVADVEIPIAVTLLRIVTAAVRTVPFALLGAWSMKQTQITGSSASMTAVLTPIAFVVTAAVCAGLNVLTTHLTSAKTYAVLASTGAVMSLTGYLAAAAMVLLCCVGAVELYAVSHTQDTPKTGA